MLQAAFIEGSHLPTPYWLVIGPFDLMEAADWLENYPQKLGQGVFKLVFVLDLQSKIPKWPSPFGLMKIRFCNVLHLGYHKNFIL